MNKIIHGDCLEVLKSFDDDSFDMVLTSPPYNMNLRIRDGKHTSRQIVKELSTKYEGYSDNLPMDEYLLLNRNVLTELLRVSPIIFYNVQFLTGNKSALFKLIGEFSDVLKEIIIWDKVNAEPSISDGVLNSRFEVLLVFDKHNAISRKFDSAQFTKGTLENLWRIPRGIKEVATHGAVFPIELATKILTNFTKENDRILDPFVGTGTTCIASKLLHRNYVGIDISEKYCKIAEQRLAQGVLL